MYMKQSDLLQFETKTGKSPSIYPRKVMHRGAKKIKMITMILGLFLMHTLEILFFVGMAGSAIVVAISFVEDIHELFGEE